MAPDCTPTEEAAFVTVEPSRIVIVLATGVAGVDALVRAVVLFPVMTVGAWVGGRLFHGLASERLYRNVALGILFATGLFGLLRNWLVG